MELIIASVILMALCCSPLWALTANATRTRTPNPVHANYPVAAGVHIYLHAIVGINPAGYLKPFVPGDVFVGLSTAEADNTSGAAGAIYCEVATSGEYELPLSGVAIGDAGKPAYATADDACALAGHPDAFVGRIVCKNATDKALIRFRAFGEVAPNGVGSIVLRLTGHETFTATGLTAGTAPVGAFDLKSILGLGFTPLDAEDGGVTLAFDATAEVALSSIRMPNDILPIDRGITAEYEMCATDKGDATALDLDIGFGTGLTTNSEANIDHADMVQLFALHMDGNSDDILLQSDDNTTDVAAVDTTIDNDSTTDVPKKFKMIVRPTGACELWVDSGSGFVRALPTTAFAMLSTANVAFFANAEKTSDDTTYVCKIRNLRIAAGCAA